MTTEIDVSIGEVANADQLLLDLNPVDGVSIDTETPRLSRHRSRTWQHGGPIYQSHSELFTPGTGNKPPPYHEVHIYQPKRIDNVQVTEDTIRNPNYDSEKYGVLKDDGGIFKSFTIQWGRDDGSPYDFWRPYNNHIYGIAMPIAQNILHSTSQGNVRPALDLVPPQGDLDSTPYGATLWNYMKPAQPTLGLGQFIGEARDIPRLLKARVEGIKTVSDFFLALKFGWEPLLRDLFDMLTFMDRIEKQIDFILNNIGKPLKRHASIRVAPLHETVYAVSNTTECWLTPVNGYKALGLTVPDYTKYSNTLTCVTETQIWGSGEFVFWFDKGRVPKKPEIRARLSGIALTPALVWELMPWSWLIDWFSNVGDVVNNLVSEVADHQASTFAYSMMHTKRSYKWVATDGYHKVAINRVFDTKVRDGINPFGLASDSTPLNDIQLAILAALGVSRRRSS